MKIILMAAVLAGMTGGVYAADFSDLQTFKASDVKNISVPVPALAKGTNAEADRTYDPLKDIAGSTPYEKLRNLFAEGIPATKENLTGWHIGRSAQSDGGLSAALLDGWEEAANTPPDSLGPLVAASPKVFKIFAVIGYSAPPDYYDNMNYAALDTLKNTYIEDNNTFQIGFPEAKGKSGSLNIEERKARGFIVEHYDGDVQTYTYYFKNVAPK